MGKCKEKDVEVLFLTDPIDEYAVQNLTEFDGKKLQAVTKEGLSFGDEDEKGVEKREKIYKEQLKPVTDGLAKVLGSKVEKVVISTRVVESPAVLVTSKKTMEVNPRHPIVIELNKQLKDDAESDAAKDLCNLLFDTAFINPGFQMEQTDEFASRMYRMMQTNLKLDSLDLADEVEIPEDEEEEKAEDGEDGDSEEAGDDAEESADAEEEAAGGDEQKEEL